MLFKDNTPSAAAFAEQCCRKADSLAECRQSDEARRTGQDIGKWSKKRIDFFWRERSLPPARFIQPSKNIPPIEYWTAYGPAAIYWLYAVPLLSFVPTFPSVACFRCRRRPLHRRERGKVFGLNTLCSQRKIQPETAQLPDLSTFRKVCANFHGR